MIKAFFKEVVLPFTVGAAIFSLMIYGAYQLRPPQQPVTLEVYSTENLKLNHVLEELSAQERQLSALEKDVQSILVEITKIRKGQK